MKIEEIYKALGYNVDKHMELSDIIHEELKSEPDWSCTIVSYSDHGNYLELYVRYLNSEKTSILKIDNTKLKYNLSYDDKLSLLNRNILIDDNNIYDIDTSSRLYKESIIISNNDSDTLYFLFKKYNKYEIYFCKKEYLVDIKLNNLSLNFSIIDNL